jgi:glutamate/tyrosine decarboxylase-like PLP-dependent enzyme
MYAILHRALEFALDYLQTKDTRTVAPASKAIDDLRHFDQMLPEHGATENEVLDHLHKTGSPATVISNGGRYFGFVTGASLPVSTAANWLAAAWDQNCALDVMSPVAARLESVVRRWMVDLLGLPPHTYSAFVTCTTMGTFTALAAARHVLLERQAWDIETKGLFGAPEIKILLGAEAHITIYRALRLLGFGSENITKVPVNTQGAMLAEAVQAIDSPTIICLQAGNVNSGAFDPFAEVCERVAGKNVWVHVDGAFGLWAAVSAQYRHLTTGMELADSWSTDGHKWLNLPYDSGVVFVKNREHLRAAMTMQAAYLRTKESSNAIDYSPEGSRRARAVDFWAGLKLLGKSGLAGLIERTCDHAKRFAHRLEEAGFEVLNDVVLNQVLVSFGSDEQTRKVIARIQEDGTCWCGGTVWHGREAMRISVSSWQTTRDDVEKSAAAIIRITSEM